MYICNSPTLLGCVDEKDNQDHHSQTKRTLESPFLRLKFNFDASFKDEKTSAACMTIMLMRTLWVFVLDTILVSLLLLLKHMLLFNPWNWLPNQKWARLCGLCSTEDCSGMAFVEEGMRFLRNQPAWKIYHTSRNCNTITHSIPNWGRSSNFCGYIFSYPP